MAAVIGHELNNIAVPLAGYAELVRHSAGTSESVGPILDEITLAIARITSLASGLESLGEKSSRPMRVAIGACIPEPGGADPAVPRIDWQCSPSTLVLVDAEHARRALQALAATTGQNGTAVASLPGWSIAQEARGAAPCAVCGVRTPHRDQVMVRGFSSHLLPLEALRDPFGSGRVGRASRRLGLAVLVHSTHCAGGHIFRDAGAGSLRLSFPLA